MKTESTVKYILRLALTLLIITAVVAALLSVVNGVTYDIIQGLNQKKTQEAIKIVLLGEDAGEDVALDYHEVEKFTDDSGLVSTVYESELGYAVQVIPSGFDGEITMMVGVGLDGKVLGISVISQTETAGLGAVCAAGNSAGTSFRNQFVGMSGDLAVTKDGGEIEAITSATITSRAVTDGVNAALKCVANLSKEG